MTINSFLMYFTIENPDVKMIEQLNVAKDQAEKGEIFILNSIGFSLILG